MDIRSQAIAYARTRGFAPDCLNAMRAACHVATDEYTEPRSTDIPNTLIIDDPVQFRIGIDNMLASAFEAGYQLAEHMIVPARPGMLARWRARRAARRHARIHDEE